MSPLKNSCCSSLNLFFQPAQRKIELSKKRIQLDLKKIMLEPADDFILKSHKVLNFLKKSHRPLSIDALVQLKEKNIKLLHRLHQVGWQGIRHAAHESIENWDKSRVKLERIIKEKPLFFKNPFLSKDFKANTGSSLDAVLNEMTQMNQFRLAAVDHITKICSQIAQEMGYQPGVWRITGTPGWNSDVDAVYFAETGMLEEDQIMIKILFDMICLAVMEGSSGRLFDTESYLNHPGAVLNTEMWMQSLEGKEGFSLLELKGALLQMIRQFKKLDHWKELWKSFKEQQLDFFGEDPSLRHVFGSVFSEIEAFCEDVDQGVEEQLARYEKAKKEAGSLQLEEDKLAMMSYKIAGLLSISKKMDDYKKEMEFLKEDLFSIKKLDRLQLELGILYLLRTSFFDEGYNTQGAFIKICFNEEGQIHERAIEKFHFRLRAAFFSKISINQLIKEGLGFKLEEVHRRKTTEQQNAASALENLAMYLGHYSKELQESAGDLSSCQEALISASKYAFRALSSNQGLLEQLLKEKKEELKEKVGFKNLFDLNLKCLVKAQEIEKVKRGRVLSTSALESLLGRCLEKNAERMDPLSRQKVICKVVSLSQPGGMLERTKYEETLIAQDKYLAIMSYLQNEGCLMIHALDEEGFVVSNSPEIDLLIKTYVGLPNSLDQNSLNKNRVCHYQREARLITLEKMGFNRIEAIAQFNQNLVHCTFNIYRLMITEGQIPRPAQKEVESLGIHYRWSEAVHEVEDFAMDVSDCL